MNIQRKKRHYWLRGLGLSLLLIGSLQLWCAWQVYRFSQPKNDLPQADAAVVLGAAAWGNRPSPVFRERINHALTLYQTGYVRKLIFTGGTPKSGYETEAEVARNFALKQGIPEQDILIEMRSKDTYQNLVNTRFLMQKHHLRDIVIISDPLHIARAMAIAEDLDIKANYSPTPTSRYHNASWQTQAALFIQESYALVIYHLLHFGRSISKMII